MDTIDNSWRHYSRDPALIEAKVCRKDKGPYIFFRWVKSAIQARMATIIDHAEIPQVQLHGSAHIDNYAKTLGGAGMVDFDRAYIGPYCWDIVCVLMAMSLRNPEYFQRFLPNSIIETFHQAYLQGFEHPEAGYALYQPLEDITPKTWEQSTHAYLAAEKKWAKQIKQDAIALDDPAAKDLLTQYLESLAEPLLQSHQLTQIAASQGTFGRDRYLYVLEPKDSKDDAIIIDIKQTRDYHEDPSWPHHEWYSTPYSNHGERLIAAAKLYAPDCVLREGFAHLEGQDYWGRQVPTFNRKPEKIMDKNALNAFALSAGSQLGRGHCLGAQNNNAKMLLEHFEKNYYYYTGLSYFLQQELLIAWQNFSDQLQGDHV